MLRHPMFIYTAFLFNKINLIFMNLEFKFNNDIWAAIDMHSKKVFPYINEQYGDSGLTPMSYENDNDLVDVLKMVSERVNLNQHRDIVGAILMYHPKCEVKHSFDGMLIVFASLDYLGNSNEFIEKLTEFGAEFVGRYLKAKIISNGVCVAEITYS